MPSARLFAGLILVGAMVAACKSTTTPPTPVPTSITFASSVAGIDAIGGTAPLTATVRDQEGNPMAGQTVTWTVSDATIASVGASGAAVTVTALKNGQTTVTATSGSVNAQATVIVQQLTTALAKISGDGQNGIVGDTLAQPLVVELRDRRGNPVPGGTGGMLVNTFVTFSVTSGGGAVVTASADVGVDGRASSLWVLGGAAGAQEAGASTFTSSASVSFSATAAAAAADSLIVVSGDGQQGTVGQPLGDSVVVKVVDAFGNGVSGWNVAFAANDAGASASPTAVNTDAAGLAATEWTLGAAPGGQTLTVTAQALTKGSPATVNATGADPISSSLLKADGDAQIGLVDKAVNIPPTVKVEDQFGNGVPGVEITFAVTGGAGSVTGATDTTDANGLARVGSWVLDAAAGPNALTASSTGLTDVQFTATGQTASFTVEVRFYGNVGNISAGATAAFQEAKTRWEALVFGDLAELPVNLTAGACGGAFADHPAVNETVDDLVILAKIDSIDGPGGVLGAAGPCWIRTGTNAPLPALGLMRFDSADVAGYVASGRFDEIVLHEMGHVLGFGTLWNQAPLNLLAGPCPIPSTNCTTDPHFTGAQAIKAFDRVGGTAYVASAKVPAENCVSGVPAGCGAAAGTINGHWRESVFGAELMTGYFPGGGATPLSIISAASLWDMNYLVTFSGADAFTWPAPPAAFAAGARDLISFGDDIHRGPLYLGDASGRIVRVIMP